MGCAGGSLSVSEEQEACSLPQTTVAGSDYKRTWSQGSRTGGRGSSLGRGMRVDVQRLRFCVSGLVDLVRITADCACAPALRMHAIRTRGTGPLGMDAPAQPDLRML